MRKLNLIPTPFQKKSATTERIKEILDFGPEPCTGDSSMSHKVNERLRELIKKLQELNDRVDKLNSRY